MSAPTGRSATTGARGRGVGRTAGPAPVSGAPVAYGIDREARRAVVRATSDPALDGIDRVEVLANRPGTPGHVPGAPQQRTLLVHLLRGPVPDGLDRDRVRVLGGVRADPALNPVLVLWAHAADAVAGGSDEDDPWLPPGVTPADRRLVAAACPVADRSRVLTVRTSSSGDWSTYVLVLLGAGGTGVPVGFDVPLSSEPFTFTVDCPHDLDCCQPQRCPPVPATSPLVDYLARDYEGLRTRLLDRVATLVPGWTDRSPADPVVALLEVFAYAGDRLTYVQDAVAAEAYLGTARLRASVHRHARLLDYRAHSGCAARTWLALTTDVDTTLVARAPAAAVATDLPATLTAQDAVEAGAVVFETLRAAELRVVRNAVELHPWGDPAACLPAGATTAWLRFPPARDPGLRAGDVLVLAPAEPLPEEAPQGTPRTLGTAEPLRRIAVRLIADPAPRPDPLAGGDTVVEIRWHGDDALTVPLPLAVRTAIGGARPAAIALANVVIAEHAASLAPTELEPPQVPLTGRWRPRLPIAGLAWADPRVDTSSAAAATRTDPGTALPQVTLDDGARTWNPVCDLLASGRLDPHLVAEGEPSGVVRLRLGDGVNGREPSAGTVPTAWLRVGGGPAGNIGAEAVDVLLALPDGRRPTADPGAVVTVTNPLRAVGGLAPQSLAEIRALAPHAFRSQLRAVTAADHAAVATGVPGVQRAVARRRWTGSWYTHEVALDPVDARADDPALPAAVLDLLDLRRMAGTDVSLGPPVVVPLDIVVGVCVADGHLRATVAAAVTDALSTRTLPDGTRGFFHPDRFTFGQALHLSDLVAAVMAVPGVAWVDVGDTGGPGSTDTPEPGELRLRRLGRPPAGEAEAGRIPAAPREVLRADGDPSNPERGRVALLVRGGL